MYYGSTTRSLNHRKKGHKDHYNEYKSGKQGYMSSFDILSQGTEWTIEIVEEVEDEEQLLVREGYYIKNNECVNNRVPGRTEEEKKEKLKEKSARWYQDNKEYYKEYKAQYREANKDHIKEYNDQYYQDNKEKIKAKRGEKGRERVQCPHCQKDLSRNSLSRHNKSQHKE